MKSIDVIQKIKELGPGKLIIAVLAGVLLLIFSCYEPGSSEEDKKSNVKQMEAQEVNDKTEEQYRITMERQLVQLLTKVQGVGKVEVMITLAASREKVTLKDNELDKEKSQEETVMTEDSDNNTNPYIIQEKEPVPEGILIVCEGGGDATVNREIIRAIQVLFDVEPHKIKVMKMQEDTR